MNEQKKPSAREYYKMLEARYSKLLKMNRVHYLELAKQLLSDDDVKQIERSVEEYSRLVMHKPTFRNLIYYEFEKFLTATFVYSLFIGKYAYAILKDPSLLQPQQKIEQLQKQVEEQHELLKEQNKLIKTYTEKALDDIIANYTQGVQFVSNTIGIDPKKTN